MRRIGKIAVAGLIVVLASAPATARRTLGLFDGWGAFSDNRPRRCYAVAEPIVRRRAAGWRPFAAISTWPGRDAHGQLNIRLRKHKLVGAPVILTIGSLRLALVAGGADAWAVSPRSDAVIQAAMRQADVMTVETRDRDGRRMVDYYLLRGVASAIDAALLSCIEGQA